MFLVTQTLCFLIRRLLGKGLERLPGVLCWSWSWESEGAWWLWQLGISQPPSEWKMQVFPQLLAYSALKQFSCLHLKIGNTMLFSFCQHCDHISLGEHEQKQSSSSPGGLPVPVLCAEARRCSEWRGSRGWNLIARRNSLLNKIIPRLKIVTS